METPFYILSFTNRLTKHYWLTRHQSGSILKKFSPDPCNLLNFNLFLSRLRIITFQNINSSQADRKTKGFVIEKGSHILLVDTTPSPGHRNSTSFPTEERPLMCPSELQAPTQITFGCFAGYVIVFDECAL